MRLIIALVASLVLSNTNALAHDINCPKGTYDNHEHIFSGGLDCISYTSTYDTKTTILRCEGVEIISNGKFTRGGGDVVNADMRWDEQCFKLESVEYVEDR